MTKRTSIDKCDGDKCICHKNLKPLDPEREAVRQRVLRERAAYMKN